MEEFAKEIKACNIAPAIRGVIRTCSSPIVKYIGDTGCSAEETENKTGLSCVVIPYEDEMQKIRKQIENRAEEINRSDMATVEKLGTFVLAKTKEEADKKAEAIVSGNHFCMTESAEPEKTRLDGKVVLITGGAQGFGKEIGKILAGNGAQVVFADINLEGAKEAARYTNEINNNSNASGIFCNVRDENSIKEMCEWVTVEYGGIDVMLSNAGIAIAGGLEQIAIDDFKLVTEVNYTGFFMAAKYASRPMKIQYEMNNAFFGDIIQTNSKAGLKGWLNNSAYCGSKFGSIGLVQSISREMVKYNIKVNAVCPGNYYEGPLWSDPEKGLFVKYYQADKVPGAKGPEDVKNWYFSQEIFGRGCHPLDVARAVMYCIEQVYETGQAIPVAGGLDMLN